MTLIVFRHAEKVSIGVSDPPLTPRGENQAGKILDLIEIKKIPKPNEIWTSEKKRTQQTALPVSKHYKIQSKVVEELNEMQRSESFEDFFRRIRRFQIKFESSALPVVMIVTHLDWIAQFTEIVSAGNTSLNGLELPDSVRSPWSSCQWGIFELKEGNWHFINGERT